MNTLEPTDEATRLSALSRLHPWLVIFLSWLAIAGMFLGLYVTARRSILDEIRSQAIGTAIATAAGIDYRDLVKVETPDDMLREEYLRVQRFITAISAKNPDVLYIYTMRRSQHTDAAIYDYEFIIDETPIDENENGVIDPEEACEEPGAYYDASELPAMIEAWIHPSADEEITPDPPYPDLISGYAPLRDENSNTVAIVGVDISADTVSAKLRAVRWVISAVAFVMALLMALVIRLYYQQRASLIINKALSLKLAGQNETLSQMNKQYEQELRLAKHVQMGLLPKSFPDHKNVVFDKFFLTCAILGGDLYDVFDITEDCIALYVADVSGHGASAALISGLVKMAVDSMKQTGSRTESCEKNILCHPDRVLGAVNEMLAPEIPRDQFVTMMYAMIDLKSSTCKMSSAGHPYAVCYQAAAKKANVWAIPTGPALGLIERSDYPTGIYKLAQGDKVLFYTDGLTEAMNEKKEEFGEKRFIEVVQREGHRPCQDVMGAIMKAVAEHRGSSEISDDFTLLAAEFR